jgi:membrane associated rhomboid family serine protease
MNGTSTIAFPRPGKVLIGLLATNVVAYVLYLLFIRAQVPVDRYLPLVPEQLLTRGWLWQPFTYMLLHDPRSPGHLLFNMLWLYMFGSQMEAWWRGRRFLSAYVIFGLSGAALTVLVGALSRLPFTGGLLDGVYFAPHLGASGAVSGVLVAWGIVHADETFNFFLLGAMKGKTFVLIMIAFELLVALSLSPVSSTSHFGGMIGAVVLCKGLWRPSRWTAMFQRRALVRRRRAIEHELRVIEGGKGKPKTPEDDDPSRWN